MLNCHEVHTFHNIVGVSNPIIQLGTYERYDKIFLFQILIVRNTCSFQVVFEGIISFQIIYLINANHFTNQKTISVILGTFL